MPTESTLLVRIIGLVFAGWLALVWTAGLLYVSVSYAESAGRLPRRSLRSAVRWILREVWLVAWVQPLILIFQVFGRRMGTGGGVVPIVLVHGYFQNRVDFLYLARRLKQAGCGPLFAFNFFWPQNLEASSKKLRAFVEHVRTVTGAESVDLLTHSAGGLLALDLIADDPGAVRRLAVIAIPAGGVPWRGPVLGRSGSQLRADSSYHSLRPRTTGGTPALSVYSAHDNIVHPVATSQLTGECVRNVEVRGPGHLSVLFERSVGDEVVDFLVR